MKYCKTITVILYLLSIICLTQMALADALYPNDTLNKLINTNITPGALSSKFPGCNDNDYYWYDQSGADFVPNTIQTESDYLVLSADSVIGQNKNEHVAKGHVVAYKNNDIIQADYLVYNQSQQRATATGHLILTRQWDVLTGSWVDYYLDLHKGTLYRASFYRDESSLYARAKTIRILNKNQMVMSDTYFTGCNPDHPAWHVVASQSTFDYQNNQGNARNFTFYAESTPLLSVPYMQFPLGKRMSGFLAPEFGTYYNNFGSTIGGFIGLPYYWDMAPNYDMTFEPKFFSADGLMLTDQFRYKTESGSGSFYTEQLPNDWQNNQNRYYFYANDTHTIYPNVQVGYTYNQVSDGNYFVNFGDFFTSVNNVNLPRSAFASYTPSWGLVDIKMQGYQVLQPTDQPPAPSIYSTLPQVDFNVNPQEILGSGLDIGLISQFSNFSSSALSLNPEPMQNGERTVLYPSLTYPLQNQWGFIKPKVGYSYTDYELQAFPGVQTTNSTADVGIPITSLDSGLVFSRNLSLGNGSYEQTLEPRLYYLYIPQVNQQNLPLFDTATATYNVNQLFSENRFSGLDRINMANDLTMGINSKLIDDNTGLEAVNWGIGYRYYITPENNFIYGNPTQDGALFLPEPNLIAELGNNWSKTLSSNFSYQYSTIYQTVDAYSAQTTYNPKPFELINVRFNYQYQLPLFYYPPVAGQPWMPVEYENQYSIDLSTQWPLWNNHWLFDARSNYDLTYGVLLNWISGLEYNGGCWSLSGLYEQYIFNINQNASGIFMELSLRGLTNFDVSGSPQTELKNNIPGYTPFSGVN